MFLERLTFLKKSCSLYLPEEILFLSAISLKMFLELSIDSLCSVLVIVHECFPYIKLCVVSRVCMDIHVSSFPGESERHATPLCFSSAGGSRAVIGISAGSRAGGHVLRAAKAHLHRPADPIPPLHTHPAWTGPALGPLCHPLRLLHHSGLTTRTEKSQNHCRRTLLIFS